MFRLLLRLSLLAIILAMMGGIYYTYTESFAQHWRRFVTEQLEERGLHLEFKRFGVGLTDGLEAREVRIYNDAEHTQILASMDRLSLDIDYGKLIQKQFFLEGMQLSRANVSLPLDPTNTGLGYLELRNFNARIFLMDDRLDIRQAEGDLAGVHLLISGTLQLPRKTAKSQGEKRVRERNVMMGLDYVRGQRERIRLGLLWLNRFTFEQRPQITFNINGSVEMPESIRATLQFDASGVRYENYVCNQLSATAEYHDRLLDVRRVLLRDAVGAFEASATWPIDGDEVQFRVATTADLPQLARSFFQSNELREVVLYQSSPPSLTLEGKWFVRGPKAGPKRPVEAVGQLRFGRFTSRGEVFDGLTASIGVTPTGYYIRDAMLRHKSGTLTLQAMSQQVEGFKYRAVLKMDPHAFLPFAAEGGVRDLINRFEFKDTSTIFVQLEGSGTDPTLSACMNQGRVELRQFKYQGVEFESWSGNLEFFNKRVVCRDVTMVPRKGQAFAEMVMVDTAARTVTLKGVKAKLDPVPLTSCFARPTAEALVKYRFGHETEVEINGTIGYRDPALTSFAIRFAAPDSTATYPVGNRDYVIRSPAGSFDIKGRLMNYDVNGRIYGGAMRAKGRVEFGKQGYTLNLEAEEFRQQVLGKDLPVEGLKVAVNASEKGSPFDISAKVLGGNMTLKGELDAGRGGDSYRGELRLSGMSFQRFAKIYTPGNESEGDITGHFQFTGKEGNWKALKGSGVLIILNGNLYAVPVLGPLTPLLGAILPGQIKGYNVAREASCNFTVADGFVVTEDVEALTSAFKLVAKGNIDFINDNIDFTAQARVRGLPGLVLRPVSELLEFRGEGSVGKPVWRPRYLSVGSGRPNDERKPPTEAEIDAAKHAVDPQMEQAAPQKSERPVVPPLGRFGR